MSKRADEKLILRGLFLLSVAKKDLELFTSTYNSAKDFLKKDPDMLEDVILKLGHLENTPEDVEFIEQVCDIIFEGNDLLKEFYKKSAMFDVLFDTVEHAKIDEIVDYFKAVLTSYLKRAESVRLKNLTYAMRNGDMELLEQALIDLEAFVNEN